MWQATCIGIVREGVLAAKQQHMYVLFFRESQCRLLTKYLSLSCNCIIRITACMLLKLLLQAW